MIEYIETLTYLTVEIANKINLGLQGSCNVHILASVSSLHLRAVQKLTENVGIAKLCYHCSHSSRNAITTLTSGNIYHLHTQRSKSVHNTPILLLVLTNHPITQMPPPSQVTTHHPYTDGEIQSCAL